jgi:PKHD-type hydroxylase
LVLRFNLLGTDSAADLVASLRIDDDDVAVDRAGRILTEALRTHSLILMGIQPRIFSHPRFCCIQGNSAHPDIVHSGIGDTGGMRADAAVTVFLTDPLCYEGGDLVIDTGYGGEIYREPAGVCVIYPASARTFVAAVTRGTRVTCEFTVQSLVRDPAHRQILYDIGCALQYHELLEGSDDADVQRLLKCRRALLHLWIEQ